MIKDTESLDYIFVHTFGENEFDSCTDFPFIALDFLKHIYPHIEDYSQYVYADDSMDKWAPDIGLRYKILNAMLGAARHGDEYAQEMICRIYKVYYKWEYNQLKRFHSISFDELCSFENDGEVLVETAARILTICPFMGIEVLPDCEYIIPDVDRMLNDKTYEYKIEPEAFTFDKETIQEAGEEARELIKRQKRKRGEFFYWRNDIAKFKCKVFQYFYLPEDYDSKCNREWESLERTIAITIGLLKKRFRNRSFTDEEILFYHEIFQQIKSFSSQIGQFDELVDMIIGRTDRFEYEKELCRYNPKKQKVVTALVKIENGKKEPERISGTDPQGSTYHFEKEEEYIRQISDLKAELKQKQQNLNEVKRKYMEVKEAVRQNQIDEELWAAERSELYRLRDYVYSMTEEDVSSSSVSMEDMKAELKDRKIIIVGGHDNWVSYLKESFPDWTYIKPSISNTLPENHAIHSEYLFFFTDTLSHGSFNKYMNVVRKHNLQYSYLHGTNIERTISSIYREVCEPKA